MINDKVILLHSTGTTEAAKVSPALTGADFGQGELAVITLKGDESILAKNSNNEIVDFPSMGKVNTAITTANGTTLANAKTYTDGEIKKVKVSNADKSIIVTTGDAGTDIKVNVKAAPNALVLGVDGLYVDQSALTSYEGKESIVIADKTGAPGTKEITLKLNENDKVLSQNASGLLSTLSLIKVGTPAEGMASQYQLVGKDGTTVLGATIDITKDQFLKSAEFIAKATAADKAIDATVVIGDPYLKFVFQTTDVDKVVYVAVKSLVDEYVAGNGIAIVNNVVSVKLDAANESFLTVGEDGLKLSGVQTAINVVKTAVDEYTVNTKKISTNPVLNGADVKLDGYSEATGSSIADLTLVPADTVNNAFGKVAKTIADNELVTAKALTQIKETIGFPLNAAYVSNTGATYINNATSLNDADVKLDAAIKTIGDTNIKTITSTGNTVTVVGTTAINLEVNPTNIALIGSDTNESRLELKDGKLFVSKTIDCGTF